MNQPYQNKSTSRIQEVAELEYVPGIDMPDRKESLLKLRKKMQEQKESKKKIFFMLAAACVTVILLVPAVMQKSGDQHANLQLVHSNVSKTIAVPAIVKDRDNVQQKEMVVQKTSPAIKHDPVIKPVEKNEPVVISPVPNLIAPITTDSPALNPIIETAVAPVKRKYPVVNINSLKTPQSTEEAIGDIKNPFRRIILRPGMPPSALPVYSSEHVINQNKNLQN
ncbi:MAG: hypothetical protein ABI402_04915 [Ferruginibacter sp.]